MSYPSSVCHLMAGDLVTDPTNPTPRRVTHVGWVSAKSRHVVMFDGDETRHEYPAGRVWPFTLIERPDAGPLDATYTVGQRVYVYSWIERRWVAGLVIETHPAPEAGDLPLYVVAIGARADIAADATMLRPDDQEVPRVGDTWISDKTGTVLTVTAQKADRPETTTDRGDFLLFAPHWRPLTRAGETTAVEYADDDWAAYALP